MTSRRTSERETKGRSGKHSPLSAVPNATEESSDDDSTEKSPVENKRRRRGEAAPPGARVAEATLKLAKVAAKSATADNLFEAKKMSHELSLAKLSSDEKKYASAVTVSENVLRAKELDLKLSALKDNQRSENDDRKRMRAEDADFAILHRIAARSDAGVLRQQNIQDMKESAASRKAAITTRRKSQVIGNMRASKCLLDMHLNQDGGGNMGGGYPGGNYGDGPHGGGSSQQGGGGYGGGGGGRQQGGGGYPGGNYGGDGQQGGGGYGGYEGGQRGGGGRGDGGRGNDVRDRRNMDDWNGDGLSGGGGGGYMGGGQHRNDESRGAAAAPSKPPQAGNWQHTRDDEEVGKNSIEEVD